MPLAGRTFRIFVSSTFNDLKAERNALQERVFPELQKLCEANQCRFQAIDLRWGVSEEAALDQQTLNICLTELKRCQEVSPRPNFIILLGDRYGWIPLPPQIDASEFREILSQICPEDKALLEWDETRPDGGGGWYRLDTNAVPDEYVLRPRHENVVAEKDFNPWSETENKVRSILFGAINKLEWTRDDKRRIKYECSATHQEIIEGALKLPDEREHVFAFLRNIQNINDLPPESVYTDTGTDKARALKDTIQLTKGVTCFPYDVTWNGSGLESHIDQFVADALKSLRGIIEEELARLKQIDDLTQENHAHKDFGDERCRHFVGREKILDDISTYISGDQPSPLIVYGPSGSGKSALMAKAVMNSENANRAAFIIRRFIGATPGSTDIRILLRNLCLEISKAFGFENLMKQELAAVSDFGTEEAIKLRDIVEKKYDVPDEYRHLFERFREFLIMIPQECKLTLFLDALDQLSATDNAHSLNWLLSQLPANVKIVTSVLEREDDAGDCLRSARTRFPESALLRLEDMPVDEGKQVLGQWLVEAYPEKKRTLTPVQMEGVLLGFGKCPIPLYLKLVFEEARRWKSFDELPCGVDEVPGLAKDIPGIIADMLHRLKDERQHGKVLVETSLGLLSASRHGLSETEILELLFDDDDLMANLKARSARSPEVKGIPTVVWLRLYHDLAPYLMERSADNTVLYNFYHRVVGETISTSHMSSEKHKTLAEYFRRKADPMGDSSWSGCYAHGLAELPYQQTQSGSMWKELEATLTDLYFIEAKSNAGMVYDLVSDYSRAKWAWPGQEVERHKEEERQRRIKAYVNQLIKHATNPDSNPLPKPPPLIEIRNLEPEADSKRDWTPLECVQAWGHFVSTHVKQLTDGEEPIFQLAWNSVESGPVAERAVQIGSEGRGISQEWLRLLVRPTFRLQSACLHVLEGHEDIVAATAISLEGARAVSGSYDGTLRLWDLETGRCLNVMVGHEDSVNAVAITADGTRAVSGSSDETVRLWRLDTGECLKVLAGHETSVRAVAITPDAKLVISGAALADTIRIWDMETGTCLRLLEGHASDVEGVGITADGKRAVSGSDDKTLRVWDLETGKCLNVLKGHASSINAISITPNGARVLSGSDDETMRVWDVESGGCLHVLETHTSLVGGVAITPDARRAIAGCADGSVRSWDLITGACLQVSEAHTGGVLGVSITPDGRRAVSGGWDCTLLVWDLSTGSVSERSKEKNTAVNFISISPDGKTAVSGSHGNCLQVWDLKRRTCLRVLEGHTSRVKAAAITPDGTLAVSGGEDCTIRVWALSTGMCLRVLEGHTSEVKTVMITLDGRKAVSESGTGEILSWDLETGRFFEKTGHQFKCGTITPDGFRVVLSGSSTISVCDLATGGCLQLLEGHTSRVATVSITPDGTLAVSGSDDKTIRVWDLATGECLRVLDGHASTVKAVSVTKDGRRVVSGSSDKTIRVWDLESGVCIMVHRSANRICSLGIHQDDLIAGDDSGRVIQLAIEKFILSRAVVTPGRHWHFDTHTWDDNYTVVCPSCGDLIVVGEEWLGRNVNCPMKDCNQPLRVNPFAAGENTSLYEKFLRHGLGRNRKNRTRKPEIMQGYLAALSALLERVGKTEEATALSFELDEVQAEILASHATESAAKRREKELTAIRWKALSCYRQGDYRRATDHLLALLNEHFEIPSTHYYLAHVYLRTDFSEGAVLHLKLAWEHRTEASIELVVLILWLQLVTSLLEGSSPVIWIARLKSILKSASTLNVDRQHKRDNIILLWHLRGLLNDSDYALLSTLRDALSDRPILRTLDQFDLWRNTPPQSLD